MSRTYIFDVVVEIGQVIFPWARIHISSVPLNYSKRVDNGLSGHERYRNSTILSRTEEVCLPDGPDHMKLAYAHVCAFVYYIYARLIRSFSCVRSTNRKVWPSALRLTCRSSTLLGRILHSRLVLHCRAVRRSLNGNSSGCVRSSVCPLVSRDVRVSKARKMFVCLDLLSLLVDFLQSRSFTKRYLARSSTASFTSDMNLSRVRVLTFSDMSVATENVISIRIVKCLMELTGNHATKLIHRHEKGQREEIFGHVSPSRIQRSSSNRTVDYCRIQSEDVSPNTFQFETVEFVVRLKAVELSVNHRKRLECLLYNSIWIPRRYNFQSIETVPGQSSPSVKGREKILDNAPPRKSPRRYGFQVVQSEGRK